MSFSPFAILTAEEMNDLVENIESIYGGNLAANSITSDKLDFTTFGWQTWTPTFTNFGGTVIKAFYMAYGKKVSFYIQVSLTGPATGKLIFTAPLPISSDEYIGGGTVNVISVGTASSSGVNSFVAYLSTETSNRFAILSSSYVNSSATVPFTWKNSDVFSFKGWYMTE